MKEVKNFDINGKYITNSEEEANALKQSPFCAKEVKDSTIDAEFESFLDIEMNLGISDKKTIERIKWYWNTYFKNKQQPKADNVVDLKSELDKLSDDERHELFGNWCRHCGSTNCQCWNDE